MVDIDLQVVAGELADPARFPALTGRRASTGEVPEPDRRWATAWTQNDKPFLSTFPYLAEPDSGFDSTHQAEDSPA